ncbi:MAG: hypothetical protein JNJ70_14345 [Verrucomicrobiales bacterium]|nr:hypothetical protein [Verrucomicrobiales bacterium]
MPHNLLYFAAFWIVTLGTVLSQDILSEKKGDSTVSFHATTSPIQEAPSNRDGIQLKTLTDPPSKKTDLLIDSENPKNLATDEIQNRDLEAQESMATAAWAMFWTSIFQVGIGGLSIFLIFLTLKETQRTLTEAEKATKASQDAAEATIKSISVSKDIADAQSRPWISVDCRITERFSFGVTHLGVSGFYLNIHATAKNHGHSPATNVIFRAETGFMTADSGDLVSKFCDKFRDIPDQTLDAIFPGETKSFSHMVFLPAKDICEYLEKMPGLGASPLVYGLIHYKSLHTVGIRQTRFQYSLGRYDQGRCLSLPAEFENWPEIDIVMFGPLGISAD